MGFLRTLLAVSVIITHAMPTLGGRVLVGGNFAVRLFFVISGFYMALILNERYVGKGAVRRFYSSRALRLLPAYYLFVLLPVLLAGAHWVVSEEPGRFGALGAWGRLWDVLGGWTKGGYLLTHLVVLGQEFTFLGAYRDADGSFLYTDALDVAGTTPAHHLLLNGVSWTLSVEMGFYLLAPWLVRGRKSIMVAVLAGSFVARAWLIRDGSENVGFWENQFLPCQMGFFMIGSLGYHALRAWQSRGVSDTILKRLGWGAFALVVPVVLGYPWLGLAWRQEVCLLLFGLSAPLVFHATQRLKWDRWIGDQSFPLYLAHPIVIVLTRAVVGPLPVAAAVWDAVFLSTVLAATALVSVAVWWGLDRPVDAYRRRFAQPRAT